MKTKFHQPVLLKESLAFLEIKKGKSYIDATVGGGGHACQIVKKGGRLLGIDRDPQAVKFARKQLTKTCLAVPQPGDGSQYSWKVVQGNFAHLKEIARKNDFAKVSGILFDLGVSSFQLNNANRGFSFLKEGPLDMRMDPRLKVKAADLLNALSQKELTKLFSKLGEEKKARTIARAVVKFRQQKKFTNTKQLAKLIQAIYHNQRKIRRIHPATKAFQALRIAVNDELINLEKGLQDARELLKKDGRLVIISFQALEDRIVKQFFKEQKKLNQLAIITKKPLVPTAKEANHNPRSRSAKLRAAVKI